MHDPWCDHLVVVVEMLPWWVRWGRQVGWVEAVGAGRERGEGGVQGQTPPPCVVTKPSKGIFIFLQTLVSSPYGLIPIHSV
jgi:hypothetical protein